MAICDICHRVNREGMHVAMGGDEKLHDVMKNASRDPAQLKVRPKMRWLLIAVLVAVAGQQAAMRRNYVSFIGQLPFHGRSRQCENVPSGA